MKQSLDNLIKQAYGEHYASRTCFMKTLY